MTGRRVGVGDLVAIPAGPNREIVGHVLFCSAYFNKVVLLALYPVDAHRDAIEILEVQSQRRLVFTGSQGIVAGRWRRLGSLQPSDEPAVVRFISGGHVWENDTAVREATVADVASLPRLLVKGAGLVEKVAQSLIESRLAQAGGVSNERVVVPERCVPPGGTKPGDGNPRRS